MSDDNQKVGARKTDLVLESGWDVARTIVTSLGSFENLLTQCTRTLESMGHKEGENEEEVDSTCFFLMRSLLASHAIRAKLHFALLTVHSDQHDESASFTAKQLIKAFKRSEHSALSAAIFRLSQGALFDKTRTRS